MDWSQLGLAIVIAFGLIAGIIGFVYLLAEYEEKVIVMMGIFVFALVVFVVYLLLEAR